jgi:hypothetical protein
MTLLKPCYRSGTLTGKRGRSTQEISEAQPAQALHSAMMSRTQAPPDRSIGVYRKAAIEERKQLRESIRQSQKLLQDIK